MVEPVGYPPEWDEVQVGDTIRVTPKVIEGVVTEVENFSPVAGDSYFSPRLTLKSGDLVRVVRRDALRDLTITEKGFPDPPKLNSLLRLGSLLFQYRRGREIGYPAEQTENIVVSVDGGTSSIPYTWGAFVKKVRGTGFPLILVREGEFRWLNEADRQPWLDIHN